MGLVDGDKRDLKRLEERQVVGFVERLRRDVQQLRTSLLDVALHLVDGRAVERRVEVMGQAVHLTQAVDHVHLVFHQRDER